MTAPAAGPGAVRPLPLAKPDAEPEPIGDGVDLRPRSTLGHAHGIGAPGAEVVMHRGRVENVGDSLRL